jgi:peptidoglycan/LPS O-acetylase OafA/YrhL
MNTIGYSWLALLYTGCLLIAVIGGVNRMQRLLCNRLLTGLGTIAYCTYLIHVPLLHISRDVSSRLNFPHTVQAVFASLMGLALTIGLASISWKYLEKPLIQRARSYVY